MIWDPVSVKELFKARADYAAKTEHMKELQTLATETEKQIQETQRKLAEIKQQIDAQVWRIRDAAERLGNAEASFLKGISE